MFSKAIVSTTLLALAAAVAATMPASQCNTANLQCCNSVTDTVTPEETMLINSLGIPISSVVVPVGLTCSPIDMFGFGTGGRCTAQPVCCSNNNYNGVIAFGCIAVILGI